MPSKRSLRRRVAALADSGDETDSDTEPDSVAFAYTVVDRDGDPLRTETIDFADSERNDSEGS